jgi:hypothetical protein
VHFTLLSIIILFRLAYFKSNYALQAVAAVVVAKAKAAAAAAAAAASISQQ